MRRPVCVACAREMTCAENDFAVKRGDSLWLGDRFGCDACGGEVVVGFGSRTSLEARPAGLVEGALDLGATS